MKKILFLSLVAVAAACCGPKCKEVCVNKLIANAAEYAGKEVTFVGKAVVTNVEAKRIAVFGCDSTKYIIVQAADTAKFCGSLCGKNVKVCGTVVEVAEGTTIADSHACGAVFVADKYYVAAKCICKADCCKKDGEKACKKDDEKKCCKKDDEKKECPATK